MQRPWRTDTLGSDKSEKSQPVHRPWSMGSLGKRENGLENGLDKGLEKGGETPSAPRWQRITETAPPPPPPTPAPVPHPRPPPHSVMRP